MAGIKISALPPVASALSTDFFPVVQGGVTSRETLSQVQTLFGFSGGILSLSAGGTSASLVASNGGLLYSTATSLAILAGTAIAGQIPRSGANSAPTWSTATYPATAGTSGNVLASDGTNFVSTSSAGIGSPLTTKGDLYTFSTVNARLPVGTINGQILQVNSGAATGLAWSTATFPSTATNAARILRADGTNWVQTTSTFADTYAASGFLYANGANNVAGLATANNGLPVTNNTGVPSILAGPGTTGNILRSNAAAAPSFSVATYPSTAGASGNALISDGTNWNSATISAVTSTITDDTTTNATMFPVWVTANTGSLPLKVSSTKMYFNPSTGALVSSVMGSSSISGFAPSTTFESATQAGSNTITSSSYVTSATSGARFIGQHARNTFASPQALASNDIIATFGAQGYGTTGFSTSAVGYLKIFAAEAWSDTAQGTKITIGTTPNTTVSPVDAITISNAGVVAFPVAPLGLTSGGTNASLTASNGGIFYSTASAAAILSGTATARQMLQSGANTTPAWSTTTWPATTTANRILYSSSTSVIGEITSANSSVLVTDGSGVPSLSTTLPAFTTSSITFSPTTGGIVGTTTNDNAAAGKVGEFVSSIISSASPVNLANGTPTDITSISLSAGDWNIEGHVYIINGTTSSVFAGWTSLTSATLPDSSLRATITAVISNGQWGSPTPFLRVSIASTTTVYLSAQANFTGGSASGVGAIYARRIR